jgi:hypothetical protein
MIHNRPAGRPALLPALAAMTWLQALVGLALFAPGALAPTANLGISRVARLAQQGRIGETAGAVLTASYAGLLVAPVLITAVERFAGTFLGLEILSFCGTTVLIWGGRQ